MVDYRLRTLPLGLLSEILVPEPKRWNSSSKIVRMETEECHVNDISCFDDDDDDDDDDPTNTAQFKGLHPVVSNCHPHR